MPYPGFPYSFATGKRTKAFYSAMENAPFASNPVYRAFSGKMCRNRVVFARNSGKGVSGGAIRGRSGVWLGGDCLALRELVDKYMSSTKMMNHRHQLSSKDRVR